MLKTTISARGEIVIPKGVREHLGLQGNKMVVLEVRGNILEIRLPEQDLAKRWEERAKRAKVDTSTWTHGDQLYEEEFS